MINTAILGCGTIGSGVYETVVRNQEILVKELGDHIRVKKILDLRTFPGEPFADLVTADFSEIENDPEISIVVETMGGTKPCYDFVKACLLKGKHVVTSNKALVAAHGTELLEIAREKNVNFLFEAAVGGGIPVIRTLGTGYAGQDIQEISGILNGTTNFILTKMDREGADFAETLKEAQDLGYAERNPEADVEGFDTCRKISILASLAEDAEVNFEEVSTEGITKVDTADLRYAKKLGAALRLLGSMRKTADGVAIFVAPVMVGRTNPLYFVDGVFNGIMIRGNTLGVTMLYGSGAGKLPTAAAVLADIIEAAKNPDRNLPFGWHEKKLHPADMGGYEGRFFVRVKGAAGDADKAAELFGGAEVIILDGTDEYALLTGAMKEKDYRAAAEKLPGIIKMFRTEDI